MNAEPLETHGLPTWPLSPPVSEPPTNASPFESRKLRILEKKPGLRIVEALCTLPRTTRRSVSGLSSALSSIARKSGEVQPISSLKPNDLKFHTNVSTTSKLPLPPVDPSKRLSSSPQPLQAPFSLAVKPSELPSPVDMEMEGFPSQTPPHPPRSVPHGQEQHHHQQVQGTPIHQSRHSFTTPTRPMGGPEPNYQTPGFQTPLQTPTWQVSPDAFQYQPAPVMTPSVPTPQLAWNQTPQMQPYPAPIIDSPHSQLGGGFQHSIQDWQRSSQPSMPMQQGFVQQSPVMISPTNDAGFWNPPPLPTQSEPNPFVEEPPMMHATTGVNPNLIFSFSSPIRPTPSQIDPQFSSQTPPDTSSRQPYEQQTRESIREKELARKSRKDRPGLHRSNTDSGFRKAKSRSVDRASLGQGLDHVPRRPSPLKRLSQVSLSSIPETLRNNRARTRLVVDDSGTARTEIVAGDDTDSVGNRRSFCQWSDTESSEDDPVMTSQRNSYILSSETGRPIKHGRLEDDFDAFASFKRPLSSASLHSLGGSAHVAPEETRRSSYGSFLNQTSSQETVVQDEEERGDAQDALRRLIGGRVKRDSSDPNATIKPRRAVTNPVISTTMFDISKFPSPSSPSPSLRPGSSTHTPLTDRSSRSNESTRCVCSNNSLEHSVAMIQCEVCAKWLHVRCIFGPAAEEAGFSPQGPYMCVFCTGQVPSSSEPMMGSGNGMGQFYGDERHAGFNTSPLGYKSGPFMG